MRRVLSIGDRVEIATGLKAGWSIRAIAAGLGRAPSVVSREVRRNRTKTRGYQVVHADVQAERRRARPQARKVALDPALAARVDVDLRRSRAPRQIAGRLTLEATDSTVELINGSPPAQGRTGSHEAIYQYIYALPKGDLAAKGILLRSKRTSRRPRPQPGGRKPVIVGMVPLDERDLVAEDRRVPGHWEGDLIIGKNGATAAATLVERTTRYTVILALPAGKDSTALADILIDHVNELPVMMRKSLTWDQGTEMARHAALTLATDLPVYFAPPRTPWARPTNETPPHAGGAPSNGLIREYIPKGEPVPTHQPYLTAIAEELNERPRPVLGYLTPPEAFERLLTGTPPVTSTP